MSVAPELRGFDAASIHQPWSDPSRLRNSGYPRPMIDLGVLRGAALAAHRACKQRGGPYVGAEAEAKRTKRR